MVVFLGDVMHGGNIDLAAMKIEKPPNHTYHNPILMNKRPKM